MRILTSLQVFAAGAAIALLAACSTSSEVAPKPQSPQSIARSLMARNDEGFNLCPDNGPLKYASDSYHELINVYAGKFAGQPRCGEIKRQFYRPVGLFVEPKSHDLYVADWIGSDIQVYHRGQTRAYFSYQDVDYMPTQVVVANDGTVIASNSSDIHSYHTGSVSTWVGRGNGRLIGVFPMTNDYLGLGVAVTQNDTVFYTDVDSTTNTVALWSMKCPAGACRSQKRVNLNGPGYGSMLVDSEDDLLINNGSLETFELPNPNPSTIPLPPNSGGLAMNQLDHHMYFVDSNNEALEVSYPGGHLIGKVSGIPGGHLDGVAVDP